MPNILIAARMIPTSTRSALAGTRFATSAPSGAAKIPPISKPTVAAVNAAQPIMTKNVTEIVAVRKNYATITVPITRRGVAP